MRAGNVAAGERSAAHTFQMLYAEGNPAILSLPLKKSWASVQYCMEKHEVLKRSSMSKALLILPLIALNQTDGGGIVIIVCIDRQMRFAGIVVVQLFVIGHHMSMTA